MKPRYNLMEELRWRGMVQDVMPGTEELLNSEMVTGYIGFDPTADSLHIGSLVQIMLLVHLQRAGHKPIALVGGATGRIGDPSFKAQERSLLDDETIEKNVHGIQQQLAKFLDFEAAENPATMANNNDWFKNYGFIDFIRDVGKHITVNYMMSKDSVKKRMETGISFTEFCYQLMQGYDFYYMNQHLNTRLQMGGADQWGNMTTGTELIRRMGGTDSFAFTTPLITKADGGKFGKTERGNVWLDAGRTSPYQFYQFWLNVSDEDAKRYIRIFTLLDKATVENLEAQHQEAPHLRILQKALAEDVTVRVHGREAYEKAVEASEILFGKGTQEALLKLSEQELLDIFEGVQQHQVSLSDVTAGVAITDFLSVHTSVFASKGEARRMLQSGGMSINKAKVTDQHQVTTADLLRDKYILITKGKKEYHLVMVTA